MSGAKFQLPRANPPVCWICNRKLHANGRSYVEVFDGGAPHPCHKSCAESDLPNPPTPELGPQGQKGGGG